MRRYISKIKIPDSWLKLETGTLGEYMFYNWFENNYQGEKLHKQKADRDYEGIDFTCEKGYKYQVKATRHHSYTFNVSLENLSEHLSCDLYVMIQIRDEYAYIESIYQRAEVMNLAKQSFKHEKSSFIYSQDLLQNKLF